MNINDSLIEFWDECVNKKTPLVIWGKDSQADSYITILHLAGIIPACVCNQDMRQQGAYFKDVPVKSLYDTFCESGDFNILVAVNKDSEQEELQCISKLLADLIPTFSNEVRIFCLSNKGTLSAELLTYYRKSKLLRQDFSIISNTCWAYDVYGYLDIEPQTPTSRMIIWPLHYIKLLDRLDSYLSLPLTFKRKCITPRYDYSNIHIVCQLGDIEIHFVHDTEFEIAGTRWKSGVEKLNRENLFIVMDDAHFPLTIDIAAAFDRLKYENKVLLTPYDFGDLRSVCRYSKDKVWLRAALNINHYIRYERFDFVKWFNNGGVGKDYEVRNLCDDIPDDYVKWLYSGGMPIHSEVYPLTLYE